jgi:hypothetical protein
MKYLKILGLAAIAAAALMAFAGTASATTLTSPKGTIVKTGTTIHAVSEGHAVLDPPFGTIECNSTVEGTTSNEGGVVGGVTQSVTGTISVLNFTGCTNATVSVIKKGTLTITSLGNGNGSLSSSGAEVTVEFIGTHCIFTTNNTAIGTVTGSGNLEGKTATLDISANISRTGGRSGAFCGTTAAWTGSYSVTKPDPLYID